MYKNRVNEIVSGMKSFGKEKYRKNELLTEMFALQQEIVNLTFNGEHASTAELKIWDVENHLEQLNKDCGNVADKEFKKFKEGSKTFCNLIKAEISGNRGEAKAFREFQFIRSKNVVLKNVELNDGEHRTELDAVVITPMEITIVEVKNTAKNIYIDENGDYYRTGEYLKLDCNISTKMAHKEEMLKKVLEAKGIRDIQISKIVVFTNNKIEVHNKCIDLRTCFVNQLADEIDRFVGTANYSNVEMELIVDAVRNAECKESYDFEFNVEQYKIDFATVMAVLEEASAEVERKESNDNAVVTEEQGLMAMAKRLVKSRYTWYVASTLIPPVSTAVAVVAMINKINKGGK